MKKLIFILGICLLVSNCKFESKPNYLNLNNPTQAQKFSIDLSADIVFRGEKGTLVEIRKHSFVDEKGIPVDNVDISLKEYYSVHDFISNRLSTKSTDGRLLKSSGMVDIQASANGKKVFLAEGAKIKLGFPRVQNSRVANLFSGVNGPNDEIIWELAEPVYLDTTVFRTEYLNGGLVGIYLDTIIGDSLYFTNHKDSFFVLPEYSENLPLTTIIDTNEKLSDFGDALNEYPVVYSGSDADLTNVVRQERARGDFDDSYFVFESMDLGLVNCDIFIDQELFPFVVKADNLQADVFIVLDELNAVIFPDYYPNNDETYQFRLPIDIPITVVAYSREKDNHLLSIEKVRSSQNKISLNLQPRKMDEIEKLVSRLN